MLNIINHLRNEPFIILFFLWIYISYNLFYSTLQVYVSSSLANLYEGIRKKDWRLVYTGVPVLLYDKGFARSRTQPRVTFVLAERGTCFALWKDTIDNLSNYKVAGPAFHTMCLSSGKLWQMKLIETFINLFRFLYVFLLRSQKSSRFQFWFKWGSIRIVAKLRETNKFTRKYYSFITRS